jgi:hypothetical protein
MKTQIVRVPVVGIQDVREHWKAEIKSVLIFLEKFIQQLAKTESQPA